MRNKRLWQDGYYDHVLREEEATIPVARYIVLNPVRAGLCEDASAYPAPGIYSVRAAGTSDRRGLVPTLVCGTLDARLKPSRYGRSAKAVALRTLG